MIGTEQPKNSFSVSQLNEYVKMLLDRNSVLADIFVRGEISNFKNNYKSGHLYFSLKDDEGLLRAVMFARAAMSLAFVPEDGMKVIVHGHVSVYTRDGQYQLYADAIQPDGIGGLYLAFEQLKRRLENEGLFAQERKKPIPRFPRHIGIIMSPTGAAIRDILDITARRFPAADIIIFPALVQGREAPASLCAGLTYFNNKKNVDVIIIGRGGGSIEDLWAFNDEKLARTVAASGIPIISAVGHESDFTICDFCADLRAPTPSAAAELAVPDVRKLNEYLHGSYDRMTGAVSRKIQGFRQILELMSKRRVLSSPYAVIEEKQQYLMGLEDTLNRVIDKVYSEKASELGIVCGKMTGLNPLAVLSRGYGAVENQDGEMIMSVRDVNTGDPVNILLRDGKLNAQVLEVIPDNK